MKQEVVPDDDPVTELSCGDYACFRKGHANGEQLFTLRSQDLSMPRVICYWILENIETASDGKLRHALDDALRARKWPRRRNPT
jgi:hypothetical protein